MSGEPRERGTVAWFNAEKGYGFISVDGRDGDVFLGDAALDHANLPAPAPGDRLSFVIGHDKHNRSRAENLKREGSDDTAARRVFEPVRP